MKKLAYYWETEDELTKPHSRILVRLPASSLRAKREATVVLRFAGLDAASHRPVITRTIRLASR